MKATTKMKMIGRSIKESACQLLRFFFLLPFTMGSSYALANEEGDGEFGIWLAEGWCTVWDYVDQGALWVGGILCLISLFKLVPGIKAFFNWIDTETALALGLIIGLLPKWGPFLGNKVDLFSQCTQFVS